MHCCCCTLLVVDLTPCQVGAHNVLGAYFSPSILYCAHPRYAKVVRHTKDGAMHYYQVVLEVRANEAVVTPEIKKETMRVGEHGVIDTNFPNNDHMEYLVKGEEGKFIGPAAGVVVTGVMVRELAVDPGTLAESWWWPKLEAMDVLQQRCYYTHA